MAIEKQIESLLKQLVASRKDRLNAAATLGRGQNMLEDILAGRAFRADALTQPAIQALPVGDEAEVAVDGEEIED